MKSPLFPVRASRMLWGLLLLTGMFARPLHAQLMLEPFDYFDPAGVVIGGIGGWASSTGGANAALQFGNLIGGGVTDPAVISERKLRLNNGNGVHARTFTDTPVGSDSVYVSFHFKITTMPTTDNYYSAILCLDNDASVSTSSGTGFRQARAGLVIYCQRVTAGAYRIGVRKNEGSATTGTTAWSAATFAPNQTIFIVGKYTFGPGAGDDTVALWINPGSLGGAEDSSPAAAATTSGNPNDSQPLLYVVLISASGGNGGGISEVDNIRVGQSWAEVTPGSPLTASQLGFTVQPLVGTVGKIMNPVAVQIQNANGLAVPSNNVPITLTLSGGSGTLSGTLTRNTDAAGLAIFNDLSLDAKGNGKQLSASAAGLTGAVSANFWIVPDLDAAVVSSPVITQAVAEAGSFILRGESGPPGQEYRVLSSTDSSVPVSQWTSLATNLFDGQGRFDSTNTAADAQRYYCVVTAGGPGMFAHQGYAGVGSPITGGGNTTNIILATNLTAFMAGTSGLEPAIVYVEGTITLRTTGNTYLGGNKTIIGLGTNATLIGDLGIFFTEEDITYSATNIIIRNLQLTNPNGYGEDDAITIKNGGAHVWVDHCTVFDCTDGLVDSTRESDFVTVSWCKFFYTAPNGHENSILIGGNDGDSTDAGKLHETIHHNWFGNLMKERMPSVRFGRAHVFNNYFNSTGNNYCTRTRLFAQVLVENNHYQDVQNPWELATSDLGINGLLFAAGNITNNCTFTTNYAADLPNNGEVVLIPGTDTLTPAATDPLGLNPPPYPYTLNPAADVADLVLTHAGAGRGPFAP
jgi:pectate lyase